MQDSEVGGGTNGEAAGLRAAGCLDDGPLAATPAAARPTAARFGETFLDSGDGRRLRDI
jgi:hypothetical protein